MRKYLPSTDTIVAKINWNVFFISLVMGLLLSAFQKAEIQPLYWIFPSGTVEEVTEQIDIFESVILEKLTLVPNTFSLKDESGGLIPQVSADESVYIPSYLAIDFQTGDVILEKNADEVRRVASLTKIMTAVVALDLADPQEEFEVSEYAADRIPTKIGVVPGEKMTLEELLHAIMLTSANDAAEVIREGIDRKYGEDVFIRAMNEKARFLGLTDTSFDNPQGFDGQENFSTARDFAILSHYAMAHYPEFEKAVSKDYAFLSENGSHKQFDLINWNGLIGVYPNTYGIKIGYTENAGKTTIVASEREGKHVLVVLLGADSILDRDYYAAVLLDQAFEKQYGFEPIGVTVEQLNEKYATWNQYY